MLSISRGGNCQKTALTPKNHANQSAFLGHCCFYNSGLPLIGISWCNAWFASVHHAPTSSDSKIRAERTWGLKLEEVRLLPTVTHPGRMLWSSPNSSSLLLPVKTETIHVSRCLRHPSCICCTENAGSTGVSGAVSLLCLDSVTLLCWLQRYQSVFFPGRHTRAGPPASEVSAVK